tara:strand:+ start:1321 stop:1875 length:555 start_codon:yes stop_codon:yes gene_type:complete
MHFISNHYKNIVKYDFFNKFNLRDVQEVPEIKKIVVNINCRTTDFKNLLTSLFVLELITVKKGEFTKSNTTNISVKVRKGFPVGCKVQLKNPQCFFFLEKLFNQIFPDVKQFNSIDFKLTETKNSVDFRIKKLFDLVELEPHYRFFKNVQSLDVSIVTSSKSYLKTLFLLKSFRFPVSTQHLKH